MSATGWTVYEMVPQKGSPTPAFRAYRHITESLAAAKSVPMSPACQYFIAEGAPGEKFTGCGVTGWLHDFACYGFSGHLVWYHVCLSDSAEQAIVLDGVCRPLYWVTNRACGQIRLDFVAGSMLDLHECDDDCDCCCGDSDTGSEGGVSDDSDE